MKKIIVLIALVAFIGVMAAPAGAAYSTVTVEMVKDLKKADEKKADKKSEKADSEKKSDCCKSKCHGDKKEKKSEDKK